MDQVTVGMVAPAFVYFPVWVATERGFFNSRGIECAIRIAGTTDGTTTALESGDTQFAMVTPEGVVGNAAKGGRLRLVAGNSNRAPLSLIGGNGKRIERIEDLRGKLIGTTSLKEGTAVMVQKMLAAHGLHYPGGLPWVRTRSAGNTCRPAPSRPGCSWFRTTILPRTLVTRT